MDTPKEKDPNESSAPDTSHLSAKTSRSSNGPSKKLVVTLVVLVVVVLAAVGGGLYYKKVQDDQNAKNAAAAAKATANKPLTPEQQITAKLTDGVNKQIAALKQDNPQALFDNDASAAQNVGRNLNESALKD